MCIHLDGRTDKKTNGKILTFMMMKMMMMVMMIMMITKASLLTKSLRGAENIINFSKPF